MGTTATEISPLQPPARDQRLSLRKRLSQPIAIELLPGKEAWLYDLGEGGLCVSGSSPLELGTTTSACFRFAEANSLIEAAGIVAWSDNSGRLGVRFTRVEPDSTVALRRWLKNGAIAASESSTMNPSPDAELATRISCLSEVADLQSVISSEQFDCDAALNLIVRRMMELTRATGAAIALREGQDVVCRARAGNAPDVGVKLSPTSLSGACFNSGTIVTLEDSDSDPRVNPDLCRQLNFRSLLVLPIISGAETMGIAEVLSPNPRNFAGGDILVLSFLTDLIASVALPRIEPDRSAVPEVLRLPDFDAAELPTVSTGCGGLDLASHVAAPTLAQPPFEAPVILSAPVEIPVAPFQSVEAVSRFAPVIPAEKVKPAAAQIIQKTDLSPRAVPGGAISRLIPLAVTVVVLLATAALLSGYYFSRSLASRRSASVIPVTSLATAANVAKPAPQSQLPVSEVAPAAASTHRGEAKVSIVPLARQATPPERAIAAASVPEELQVTHGASRRPVINADNAAPEAPAFGAIASRGPGTLPTSIIAAKTATPELQPPAASTGITEGKLLRKVMPRYPEMARTAGVSGDVVLSAKIATDGTLRDLKVLAGSPLLREAAIEAARQWRYSPYKLGGVPVETETRITISFHR